MEYRALPFTLRPGRVGQVGLFVGMLLATAASVMMIRDGEAMGWFCALFFGAGLVVAGLQLRPGSTWLTVDEHGMEWCSLFRRGRIAWTDIAEFGVWGAPPYGLRKVVGFNYTDAYHAARGMRGVNRAILGLEGMLPSTYGMKAKALAELLAWHHAERCGRGSAAPAPIDA